MIQKYFPRDKNYLLKEAQDNTRPLLLRHLLSEVKKAYFLQFNPLGLDDPLSLMVKKSSPKDLSCLNEFYEALSAVYRFKFGENQLQFLFDGRSHIEKYSEDWTRSYFEWVLLFCRSENFIKATLELTMILPSNKDSIIMSGRMKAFLASHFEVRIHKSRGIMEKSAA